MSKINNIAQTIEHIKTNLSEYYDTNEIDSFVYLILEHLMSMSRIQVQMEKSRLIDIKYVNIINDYLIDLKQYKPLQYILGETEFYDLKFYVTKDTLIPRPETEELVQLIIQNNISPKTKILDIGTGTGCIPICLATNIANSIVSTVDVSEAAIKVAKRNAQINKVDIKFLNRDILKWEDYSWDNSYDIIVSNPPYVRDLEKELMHDNVLKYEPDLALFVRDNDPLIFYRRICQLAMKYLKKDGVLYFEINEYLGKDMIKLLEDAGFINISLKKDMSGRDRMMSAQKK